MGQLEVQSSFGKQRRRWGVMVKYILKRVDLSGFVQFSSGGLMLKRYKPGYFVTVCFRRYLAMRTLLYEGFFHCIESNEKFAAVCVSHCRDD